MSTTRRLVSLGMCTAVAVLVSGAAFGELDKNAQKCIDQYNNKLRLVSAQAGKSLTACVKNASKGKEANPNNCVVANTDGKIAGKESKVSALYPAKCTGSEPIQQGAATGNAAHRNALTEFGRDLYGDPITVTTVGKNSAKCLQKATQRPTQAFTELIKAHRKCKKDKMKAGTVEDEATLDAQCGNFAQIDAGGKAAAKFAKSTTDISTACNGTEEPLGTLFSGLSGSCHASGAALAACINARALCRACETLNEADGQDIDCDLMDDNTANQSCGVPQIGSHVCTMNNGGGSGLNLSTQALPLTPTASGAIEVDCGAINPIDGKASCDCNLISLDPVALLAIGDVCVSPAPGCPSGEIDCDGGNAMDTDLQADHNIGGCASNAACAASCDAHCAGIGPAYTAIASGCEGFCDGGSNNEGACTATTQCPGGTCVGASNILHTGVCNCVCSGTGLGGPSPAGSLSCNVGVQINVELPQTGSCGDGPFTSLLILAPQCGAVTTTTSTGQITDTNNVGAKMLPVAPAVLNGAGISCATLETSTTTGLKLVGQLAFFGSTLGDVHSGNTFQCN